MIREFPRRCFGLTLFSFSETQFPRCRLKHWTSSRPTILFVGREDDCSVSEELACSQLYGRSPLSFIPKSNESCKTPCFSDRGRFKDDCVACDGESWGVFLEGTPSFADMSLNMVAQYLCGLPQEDSLLAALVRTGIDGPSSFHSNSWLLPYQDSTSEAESCFSEVSRSFCSSFAIRLGKSFRTSITLSRACKRSVVNNYACYKSSWR
jgi:hypothetical protein